jgi:ADP-heptose:LPS heptosyltransferase
MSDDTNILLIRNDKLGDFMLAWPALSLIKKQYPGARVSVLVPSYTQPIAELCPWIDDIITDDRREGTISDARHLAAKLRTHNFDVSISLFSELRTALALWLARVPLRYGPATKLAQLFLNRRLRQKRSLSLKPEYEYNIDLVKHYIAANDDNITETPPPPYLSFDQKEVAGLRSEYSGLHDIAPDRKLIFIHAGTGGSAINLSQQQFADLAGFISNSHSAHFVLTAGPDELDTAEALSQKMGDTEHSIYHSTEGLASFAKFISMCDLFISGSTGPLHIAGALNVNTAAFYPARRSATPLRWQTINEEKKRIYFSPEKYTGSGDMQTIDIAACADSINRWLSLPHQP